MPSRRAAAERLPFARSSARRMSSFSTRATAGVQRQVVAVGRRRRHAAQAHAGCRAGPRRRSPRRRTERPRAASTWKSSRTLPGQGYAKRRCHRRFRDGARRRAAQRVRDEQRDVAAPRAQRRDLDLDDREPVVEILAQRDAGRARPHRPVGRGDDARVAARAARCRPRARRSPPARRAGAWSAAPDPDRRSRRGRACPRPPPRSGRCAGAVAPVNAPRSWPKSSLSISVGGSAARLTATNGSRARAPSSA